MTRRVNARAYDAGFPFDLRTVQTQRQLSEDEVVRINTILKQRASHFMVASKKEWLYPEDSVPQAVAWAKLNDDWFLMPNPYKVGFKTGFVAGGFPDGRSPLAFDEHGRRPGEPGYNDEALMRREMRQFDKAKHT